MVQAATSRLHSRVSEFMFKCLKKDVDFSIANTLLENINEIQDANISEIAYLANTTPASVSKFCKKIGYTSFLELKKDAEPFYLNPILDRFSLEKNTKENMDIFLKDAYEIDRQINQKVDKNQIHSISNACINGKNVVVISSSYSFPNANLLREMLVQNGINVIEINRNAREDVLEYALEKCDVVFIISLSGAWIREHQELLSKFEHIFKIVITYIPMIPEFTLLQEVVSFSDYELVLSSTFYSQRALLTWIVLLGATIKDELNPFSKT
ncbi:hypothetical protein IGI39_004664 [Enterococcus sp. AZ135]|uniref:MurR/RpiR family transcriptional regulator n=1 Tax=unclassified Enterococcus TaxID=2608891 RepID=UPI003F2834C2